MREIKFRGQVCNPCDDSNGEWVYGSLVTQTNDGPQIVEELIHVDGYEFSCKSWLVFPETVGQYTGLKDKNGVEIYEGDVIENINYTRYKAIYDADYFGFVLKRMCADMEEPEYIYGDEVYWQSYTIIGNIHDKEEAK